MLIIQTIRLRMLKQIEINQICHICLEDFENPKPIKMCCDAYICKGCIHDLIENEHNKCPICKKELVEKKTLCETIIQSRIFMFIKYLFIYYVLMCVCLFCIYILIKES